MRTFVLYRIEDETGVSGEGVVAEGIQYSDGRVSLRWRTETASTADYDSMEDVEKIHGHEGSTIVVWVTTEHDAEESLLKVLRELGGK